MQIKRFNLNRSTIQEFAEKHDLVMEVHERSHKDSPSRYYAHFVDAEISEGRILVGSFGDGRTEEEAIQNYAAEISGKVLVIGANKKERREIIVPILVS